SSQLFSEARVLRQSFREARSGSRGESGKTQQLSQPGSYMREHSMSKGKIWIGGGIVVAAALFALSYKFDFPPGGQNTVGTIVPAQRYIAPQAQDTKLGGQAASGQT